MWNSTQIIKPCDQPWVLVDSNNWSKSKETGRLQCLKDFTNSNRSLLIPLFSITADTPFKFKIVQRLHQKITEEKIKRRGFNNQTIIWQCLSILINHTIDHSWKRKYLAFFEVTAQLCTNKEGCNYIGRYGTLAQYKKMLFQSLKEHYQSLSHNLRRDWKSAIRKKM